MLYRVLQTSHPVPPLFHSLLHSPMFIAHSRIQHNNISMKTAGDNFEFNTGRLCTQHEKISMKTAGDNFKFNTGRHRTQHENISTKTASDNFEFNTGRPCTQHKNILTKATGKNCEFNTGRLHTQHENISTKTVGERRQTHRPSDAASKSQLNHFLLAVQSLVSKSSSGVAVGIDFVSAGVELGKWNTYTELSKATVSTVIYARSKKRRTSKSNKKGQQKRTIVAEKNLTFRSRQSKSHGKPDAFLDRLLSVTVSNLKFYIKPDEIRKIFERSNVAWMSVFSKVNFTHTRKSLHSHKIHCKRTI